MPASTPPRFARVLIVDASQESRCVLSALLERDGAEVTDVATPAEAVAARERRPEVVVVDADTIEPAAAESLAREIGVTDAAIVVAGTNRPAWAAGEGVIFQRKPYHYRELLHKIWASRGAVAEPAKAAA